MTSQRYRFDHFTLDVANRQLRRNGESVELSSRYLDALGLLLRENGKLVPKQRFLDDVWRGVPVTDEALTQCVMTLRKILGDNAAAPRFIETVPKHGYRFIAGVEIDDGAGRESGPHRPDRRQALRRRVLRTGLAGTAGGALAGLCGGVLYGIVGAAQPIGQGIGAASTLLVMATLSLLVGTLAGAGVSFGLAAAEAAPRDGIAWRAAGGAAGGLIIGAVVKMMGVDTLALLHGSAPLQVTGAAEGAVVGAAVGIGSWLARRVGKRSSTAAVASSAALLGGAAGALVTLLGGRMWAASIDAVIGVFPNARLHTDMVGPLFGEAGFGPISRLATGAIEGAIFTAFVVVAIHVAQSATRRGVP